MKSFTGVFTALVTPFIKGEIDWDSLRKLIRFQLDNGVHGFVVCGTTGESPTLTHDEKKQLFLFIKSEVAGAVPLMMGTGSNCTRRTIEATREAEAWGADAALVVVPYYNKPPQRGLFEHFRATSEASGLPIFLYNVPGRTITGLELETISELSRLPRIIGIKEATGDVEFGQQVVAECEHDFIVTSGDDGTFIDLMAVGGQGVISVASHILPAKFVSWYQESRQGKHEPVVEFAQYRDLNSYLYVEANPIPIKMALYLMGIIKTAEMRTPHTTLGEDKTSELRTKLKSVGLV